MIGELGGLGEICESTVERPFALALISASSQMYTTRCHCSPVLTTLLLLRRHCR